MRPRDEKRSFSTISGRTLANSNSDGNLDEPTSMSRNNITAYNTTFNSNKLKSHYGYKATDPK